MSNSDWLFLHKDGQIRLQTPEPLSEELWGKLDAYVQILKPSKSIGTVIAENARERTNGLTVEEKAALLERGMELISEPPQSI